MKLYLLELVCTMLSSGKVGKHWPGMSVSLFFYSQVELRSALWSETKWRQSLTARELTGRAQEWVQGRQFGAKVDCPRRGQEHLLDFTAVATVNLISLIKFSENEHLKWGQIEQRKWMENSIHLHALQSSQSIKIWIKSKFLYEESFHI